MSKWKDTSNHWSKTEKRNEVLEKVVKHLVHGRLGKPHTKATKEKISETKKGIKVWDGKREKMSWMIGNKFRKGKSPWNKGKEYLAVKGKNNVNWKGGVTSLNEKIRKSVEYKLWRTAIFERDNYTCIWCGQVGGKLNADHIKLFALFPELRFAIDNGRTLCEDCHKKTDTYLSIKPSLL